MNAENIVSSESGIKTPGVLTPGVSLSSKPSAILDPTRGSALHIKHLALLNAKSDLEKVELEVKLLELQVENVKLRRSAVGEIFQRRQKEFEEIQTELGLAKDCSYSRQVDGTYIIRQKV